VSAVSLDPLVRKLSRGLLAQTRPLAQRMADRIAAEEPFYRDEVPAEELWRSCRDNLGYVLGQLAGLPAEVEAPRATGVARAEQGVPFAAVLQAFRIGGRFIWELLVEHADEAAREPLLRSAADVWAASDNLSAEVTDAYRTASADRARHDLQVRGALVDALLDGTGANGGRLQESATLLRLPPHGRLVVVAAECPAPGEDALPRIEDVLRRADVASVWRFDAERQEGVVALRPRYGTLRLARDLARLALGRVGVSAEYGQLEQTAAALRESRLACAAATPGSTGLVRFDEQPVAVLLASTPDAAELLARRILGRVLDLPDDDRAVALNTVRVWLAEAGSTSAAAAQLHVHRNTVRYRLRRLEQLTGRDLTRPVDLGEIHIALESVRIRALG
jgi:hypothetical protein